MLNFNIPVSKKSLLIRRGTLYFIVQWNLDLTKSLGTGQMCSLNGGFVISKTSM